MAVALTILDIDNSGKSTYVTCKLTFSGSYSTGGDTVDLTTIMGKEYLGRIAIATKPPLYGWAAGSTGHSYAILPGTTLANGKVKINVSAGTELGVVTYASVNISTDGNIYAGFVFDQQL